MSAAEKSDNYGFGQLSINAVAGGLDGNDSYKFTKYTAPNLAMTDLKAGNIDIACVSTEVAAQFYNDGADIQVLAINCLNSLCLLTNDNVTINSIYDLEGKTVYSTMQGTPKLIFKALLDAYGVNATISHVIGEGDNALTISSPDKIAPILVQNKADIVLSPVHIAYNAMEKPSTKVSSRLVLRGKSCCISKGSSFEIMVQYLRPCFISV